MPNEPAHGDVHVTCGDRGEADRIAAALVDERLAACVQLTPVTSVFRWEGAIEHDDEILLVAKSRRDLFEGVVRRIEELHSYDLPAITFHPCEASDATSAWLDQSVGVDANDT